MAVPQYHLTGGKTLGEFVKHSQFVILSDRRESKDLPAEQTRSMPKVRRSFDTLRLLRMTYLTMVRIRRDSSITGNCTAERS